MPKTITKCPNAVRMLLITLVRITETALLNFTIGHARLHISPETGFDPFDQSLLDYADKCDVNGNSDTGKSMQFGPRCMKVYKLFY